MKNKESNPPQDELLYIGTSEQIAKLAPVKGIDGPVVLTNVYPGFFCKNQFGNTTKWGIVTVSVKNLKKDMLFALSINKKKKAIDFSKSGKGQWDVFLSDYGFCIYESTIPKFAVEKVSIYQPYGRESNTTINDLIENQNPFEHKLNYVKGLEITKWLNGSEIQSAVFCNGNGFKVAKDFDKEICNRSGLDIYYIKPEEKIRKSHKSAAKEQMCD